MAKKDMPCANPSWNSIWQDSDAKERHEMNLLSREFGFNTFVGRLVTQWCLKCGKWRLHYVPQSRDIKGFTPTDETFPCVKCGSALLLVLSDERTMLKNI